MKEKKKEREWRKRKEKKRKERKIILIKCIRLVGYFRDFSFFFWIFLDDESYEVVVDEERLVVGLLQKDADVLEDG